MRLNSILMVTLLLLLSSGCGSGRDNTTSTYSSVQDKMAWLTQAEPLISSTNSFPPQFTFDMNRAAGSGLTPTAIDFIQRLLHYTNQVSASSVILGAEANLSLDADIETFFSAYAKGEVKQSDHDGHFFYPMDHCGGSRENPEPCPPWNKAGMTWGTRDEVVVVLERLGYHLTKKYASEGGFGNDYTFPLSVPCSSEGVFRNQAIPENRGPMQWSYRWQRDLNPEVLDQPLWGDWPHWWWPAYVRWWHGVC